MGAQCGPAGACEPSTNTFTKATHWGPVGWKGFMFGHSAPEQIGQYGDVVLTKQFNSDPGVQLRSLGIVPGEWMVMSGSLLPIWQQTRTPGNVPGGQRMGSQASMGSLTPWNAAEATQAVTAAQVAQSQGAYAFINALSEANMRPA
jgi:hypothetical protein